MSLHIQHRRGAMVALEITMGIAGTTAALMLRRAPSNDDDVDVESCLANLYRLELISAN